MVLMSVTVGKPMSSINAANVLKGASRRNRLLQAPKEQNLHIPTSAMTTFNASPAVVENKGPQHSAASFS
jgi:hypothetical protein